MALIDENGDLFGRVNAVDALVVVLVLLVVLVAGIVGVSALGSEPEPVLTQVVEVRAEGVSTAVAEGIETGPVAASGIVAVENTSVATVDGNRTLTLRVRLNVRSTEDGLVVFDGERLYIGRELTLELDEVSVTGVVVAAEEPEELVATPTVSPTPTPSPTPSPTRTPTPSPTPTPSTPTPTASPTPDELATPGQLETTTQTVLVEALVSESAVDSLEAGPVSSDGIVTVRSFSATNAGGLWRLELRVVLRVQTSSDGDLFYRGVELVEGQQLVLDLDNVTIRGTVREV